MDDEPTTGSCRTLCIVTVVLNDPIGLSRTLSSIATQVKPVRVIVVDGGSCDGTLNVAMHFASVLDVDIFSRKDRGPYDGMNRGLSHLRDEDFVWFLNAGDEITQEDVTSLLAQEVNQPGYTWGYGPVRILESSGKLRQVTFHRPFSPLRLAYDLPAVCHQSVVANVGAIRAVGAFNVGLKIAADFSLELRLADRHTPVVRQFPIANFRAGGMSDKHIVRNIREQGSVRRQHLRLSGVHLVFDFAFDVGRLGRYAGGLLLRFLVIIKVIPEEWRSTRWGRLLRRS